MNNKKIQVLHVVARFFDDMKFSKEDVKSVKISNRGAIVVVKDKQYMLRIADDQYNIEHVIRIPRVGPREYINKQIALLSTLFETNEEKE